MKSSALRDRIPRLSPVWLVPLAALLIGLWLLYDNLSSQGQTITLIMQDAAGIEAGKTPLKTHSVTIGEVSAVKLSDDYSKVLVTVTLQAGTDGLLHSDSQFWVVKPRIGKEGISGLGTVLSGPYIEMLPGKSHDFKTRFTVSKQPPINRDGSQGIILNLTGAVGSKLDTGDPVLYRGLEVGRVMSTSFNVTDHKVHYRVFIRQPYPVLVNSNSRFWNIAGLDFRLNAQGLKVRIPSVESLLGGGVAFGSPDPNLPAGKPVHNGDHFVLYQNKQKAHQGMYDHALAYVLLIKDSVRGLTAGSPVEYRGVRVGTVKAVPWRLSQQDLDSLDGFAIPVLIHIEPQRFIGRHNNTPIETWKKRFSKAFKGGLRASLEKGNLLTGALYVNLDFVDKPHPWKTRQFAGVTVFPSVPSNLSQLEDQINRFVKTLNGLPLDSIANKLNRNLAVSEKMLTSLKQASQSLNQRLNDPALKSLPKQVDGTLDALQQLIRRTQPLIDTLKQHPNSLIFGRPESHDPMPGASHD